MDVKVGTHNEDEVHGNEVHGNETIQDIRAKLSEVQRENSLLQNRVTTLESQLRQNEESDKRNESLVREIAALKTTVLDLQKRMSIGLKELELKTIAHTNLKTTSEGKDAKVTKLKQKLTDYEEEDRRGDGRIRELRRGLGGAFEEIMSLWPLEYERLKSAYDEKERQVEQLKKKVNDMLAEMLELLPMSEECTVLLP